MKRFTRPLALAIGVGIAVAGAGVSSADEPPQVTQVVVLDTNGKTDQLLAEAKNNQKIFERLGIEAERRYMQASFAGTTAGSIAVVIEYPNLASLAAAQEKLQNDAEWQAYLDKITAAGMSVRSNSLWVDRTP